VNAPSPLQITFETLHPGDRLPSLTGRTVNRSSFWCDSLAGRYLVFAFFLTGSDPLSRSAVEAITRNRRRFDDDFASLFAVSLDPADEAELRGREATPGVRFLWDFEASISRACGAVPLQDLPESAKVARRFWLVVDPTLHVLARLPFRADDPEHSAVFAFLDQLPPPKAFGGGELPAPVLMLPNVFESAFCGQLIELYDQNGGQESGVMRDDKGVLDASFKRRKDYIIGDQGVIAGAIARIRRRVVPELERLFFHTATRIERHIVACYAAEDGGHFSPHRDNTPGITQHRRFAVSINLNDGFEGGGVRFPEYSPREYKAPPGWALVFPCGALHAVSRVRSGRRYCYLPFLFDEAGAKLREDYLAGMQSAQPPPAVESASAEAGDRWS